MVVKPYQRRSDSRRQPVAAAISVARSICTGWCTVVTSGWSSPSMP
jgi:hypothetical protein